MANKLTINTLEDRDYATKEAFNGLRTNLQFCGDDIKTVMVTSCAPNEGKSTVSVELSRALAEDGKKVVFVDADLRKSIIIGSLGIEIDGDYMGLSHYLSGQCTLEEALYSTNISNLQMILAGPVAPNPTERLGTDIFKEMIEKLSKNNDIVIIDSPPIGSVIDAAVIAPNTDGVIMVIESNTISYHLAHKAKQQLEVAGCNILGVVLNKVEKKDGYYKGYYSKYKYYGEYK